MNALSSQELKFTLAVSIKCNLIWQGTHLFSNVDIEGSCIAFFTNRNDSDSSAFIPFYIALVLYQPEKSSNFLAKFIH